MKEDIKKENIMTFRIALGLLLGCISFGMLSYSYDLEAVEDHNSFYEEALVLKELSLFQGADDDFELERYATRLEAGIIVVRLLGLEQEAFEHHYQHPFTDVASWADDHIGLLYHYNLTSGYGNDIFGAKDLVTPEQFVTFCLRALDYKDDLGDFNWEESLEYAQEINLIDNNFKQYLQRYDGIYRDDIVAILYNLLNQKIKDSDYALIDKLINLQVFQKKEAIQLGIYRQPLLFSKMTRVLEIRDTHKAIVIEQRNDVDYIVTIPFSSLENNFISYLLVEDSEGQQYQCYIPYEVFLADEQYAHMRVGDEYLAYGDLVINVIKDGSSIDMKVRLKNE